MHVQVESSVHSRGRMGGDVISRSECNVPMLAISASWSTLGSQGMGALVAYEVLKHMKSKGCAELVFASNEKRTLPALAS